MQRLRLGLGLMVITFALCCLVVASASAVTWHTNGVKAFASTNAGATRLIIHSSGFLFACSSFSSSGTLNGPTSTNVPWVNAATFTPALTGCTVGGAGGYAFICAAAELRALRYAGGETLATAAGGITTGSLQNFNCKLQIGPTTCSTITGSLPVHYRNPSPIATGTGTLTLTTSGQQLRAHQIGPGCAAIPNGVVTLGSPGAGSTVTDLTVSTHGPNAPYIYRTP